MRNISLLVEDVAHEDFLIDWFNACNTNLRNGSKHGIEYSDPGVRYSSS